MREIYLYHNALDLVLGTLRSNGIGIEHRRAQVITQDIEEKLWERGVIGFHSPQSLLNAVFTTMVKMLFEGSA